MSFRLIILQLDRITDNVMRINILDRERERDRDREREGCGHRHREIRRET